MGFELRAEIDSSRRINAGDEGTRIGLAIWYPARGRVVPTQALTALDYRLLEFSRPLNESDRNAYEAREVSALVGWRHIGIVALTEAQARASLHAPGMAVRGASPAEGRFPVVMLLGGQYYLSTTAEILASHGFLVVSSFRFSDQSNEIGTAESTWYVENGVRDAEWALSEVRNHPSADVSYVSAIGHGGGGMQAMLFAMRNRQVTAAVNIDAGNFSTRSQPRAKPFYSPRLMRAPYLYIATAATKREQDLFADFLAMRFSERHEVILQGAEVRHHDLSDLGRAVTAPLGIRGESQALVQEHYRDVQELVVQFLAQHSPARANGVSGFREWLQTQHPAGRFAVTVHRGSEPAPTVVRVLETLDESTPAKIRDARLRDPEAPLFQSDSLERVTVKALAARDVHTAVGLADFALELYPTSAAFRGLKSQALEGRGDVAGAREAASVCAVMQAENDWRAQIAIDQCKERLKRLTDR